MSESGHETTPLLTRLRKWEQYEDRLILLLALVIGAVTGLAVVAFILLTEREGMRLYPAGGASWRHVLFPVFGSLGIGYLLFRYFPDARGSGVPQTKAALYARDGKITLRTVLGKFFCTSATLASGIPLGREGPSVQVGAGIASVLGRRLGLRPEKVKALLPIGAAAAIAAAFNTPLAAVLFALEEVVGDLNAPVMGGVVIASATSWMVLRLMLGNSPLFKVPQYELVHPAEFAVYAVLGVAGGLVSAIFTRLLLGMREWFLGLSKKTLWFQPVAGGLSVGLLGWFVPQVLGVGYGYVGKALNGQMALELMALLVLMKLVTVTISYASGNAGGIFGPALFIGAMLGGCVGTLAHRLFPLHTAMPGAYALVGMGAVFAGIVRAPMTSVLMIFEMTQDYAVIVPLMISNLVSLFIASRLQKRPIYEALAIQDGVHLPSSESRRHRDRRQVMRIMRPPTETLSAQMTLGEAMKQVGSSKVQTWLVADARGVVGVINFANMDRAIDADKTLGDFVNPIDFPHVHADHGLDLALDRMGANQVEILPVVNRANVHQLEGIVTLHDVLVSYGVGQGS
ncbi:Cl- channel, voltage gated [Candidatus Koribacter versatilis Ellin345]|uniref:Cl-channel, voltage gated n=1 Tax=Koribacter versatilis (strain Ellin345) TaxID=204669 RepID=Q1IQI6_KORVE|nr:chloride channel protein [Candidatus Koribacter versatilis]ABF40864.1 Cl- channel, voltage gated [Candidatus Koribacter versatilis Ellin345]